MHARMWRLAAGIAVIAAGVVAAGGPITDAMAAPVPRGQLPPRGMVFITSRGEIFYLDESGKEVKRFTPKDLAGDGWHPIGVSRDGTRAVLIENAKEGKDESAYQICFAPLTPDGPAVHTLTVGSRGTRYCRWSPGRRILLGVSNGQVFGHRTRNVIFDQVDQSWTDLPSGLSDGRCNWNYSVFDWSPDGKWLLTGVDGGTSGGPLNLMRSDGTTNRYITDKDTCTRFAQFSPDGSTVLYDRREKGGAIELVTQKLAGQLYMTIVRRDSTDVFDSHSFAWKPDGKRIAMLYWPHRADAGEGWLETCDPDGGNRKMLNVSNRADHYYLVGWR